MCRDQIIIYDEREIMRNVVKVNWNMQRIGTVEVMEPRLSILNVKLPSFFLILQPAIKRAKSRKAVGSGQ